MTPRLVPAAATVLAAIFILSCSGGSAVTAEVTNHSYARPNEVVTTHISLDLDVDFEREVISGTAALEIENKTGSDRLYLDTWALHIKKVTLDNGEVETTFVLGDSLPILGRPLIIDIKPHTRRVTVHYETTADARGVQWLKPVQTADGKHPFLYTQSQSILARSWVPCQDNPGVRITYDARVRVPAGLMALMSARNAKEKSANGVYTFEMPQPIPAYLLALAVGDVEYRAISDRCGVYAEPSLVEKAAWEFADMEKMTAVAEEMYGPYRWEQFDVIVLPPSFPYGGMENPRLTFATPILVAGDRSLVSTIAHELAHSWSGNLVTNGTWNDFWLNEGFTTYFERRIMERLYGRDRSEMDAMLGRKELEDEVANEPDSLDTALYIPLGDRDPDEELGWTPYEKGYLFLRLLEETVGRERFDEFLRQYFDTFAFQTMTTEKFISYMERELLDSETQAAGLRIDEWVYQSGIPENAPRAESDRFERVEAEASAWQSGKSEDKLHTKDWSSPEWQHFLSKLEEPISAERMASLERAFAFSTANGEVERSWLLKVIENKYEPAYPELEEYLVRVGRRWLVRPLYTKLAETDDGKYLAKRIYRRARPGYHSVTTATMDAILEWAP